LPALAQYPVDRRVNEVVCIGEQENGPV
jgi:hypothetical protein